MVLLDWVSLAFVRSAVVLIMVFVLLCSSIFWKPDAVIAARRPILFVTDEMIEEARSRVEDKLEPWYSAWLKILNSTAFALERPVREPYRGRDSMIYFEIATGAAGTARDLAMVYAITGNEEYGLKAKETILRWASGSPVPGSDLDIESASPNVGARVSRPTVTFCYAYSLAYPCFTVDERSVVEVWLRMLSQVIRDAHMRWINSGYFGGQQLNGHLTNHNMGLAIIGFTVGDQSLIDYAIDSPFNPRNWMYMLEHCILMPGDEADLHAADPSCNTPGGHILTGEVYERFRVAQGTGHAIHYSMGSLRFLTLVAEAAYNNGIDLYSFEGKGGETLEVAYEFYSRFFISGDTQTPGGHYQGENVDPADVHVFEIVYRRYPDNFKIRQALESVDRVVYHGEQLGGTALLTHGLPIE
jgi:hypothetical protein